MPFSYNSLLSSQRNIDESGTELFMPNLVLYASPGCLFDIRWKVNATGTNAEGNPENVKNKMFSFRWKMYAPQGVSAPPAPGIGFKFKTDDSDTAAAAPMVFQGSLFQNETNINYSATLEVLSATQVEIRWRCYCVSEDPGYVPIYINNLFRFLSAKNQGPYMTMPAGTAFEPTAAQGISISTLVSEMPVTTPPSPAYLQVGTKDLFAPIVLYWHGRKAANAGYQWILETFTNTTGSGNVIAEKIHKPTGLAWDRFYDNNFIESSASLSPIEDNNLYFKFVKSDGASADMGTVRAIVMRVNDIDSTTQFIADYEASIGNIPSSDTGMGQISGAIHAPASVVNTGSAQCEVRFRIPPWHVVAGARYRILIVMYGTGTQRPYSGVTHELTADDHPNIYPSADIFTADYFQESILPRGLMGYHSAFRSRIEIQKASIANSFEYYGLTGSFDSNVSYIKAQVVRAGTENAVGLTPEVGPEKFLWLNGAGMQQGQSFTDGATLFEGSFYDFIDEQWLPRAGSVDALYYISVQWEIGITSSIPNGETVFLKCQYQQKIDARRWESEDGQPTPPPFNLTMTLYRLDEATIIPDGTQYLCGQDEILALVEKSEDIVDIDAYCIPETYGETETDGTTTDQTIKQRHGAFMGFIPASVNPEINAYDALFSLNSVMGSTINDAGIRVDIRDLGSNQKFWLVALARKVWPNAVPFIADDVTVDMVRDGGDVTTITVSFLDWWIAFVAAVGSSVSPYNFRIVNSATQNFAGIEDGAFNNPSVDDTEIEVTVDHNIYPQLLQIDVIYEIEGTIVVSSENHLVRFMVRKTFDLPTSAGTINETIVTADWKSVDFDF